jgi:hypothetical protein
VAPGSDFWFDYATSHHWNEYNWNATSRKFETKLEGQSQSFHACVEHGQSVNMNMYSTRRAQNLQKFFLTALKLSIDAFIQGKPPSWLYFYFYFYFYCIIGTLAPWTGLARESRA